MSTAGLGANAFKNGHDTKLIDIAIEAVKGNAGAENKPVVETAKRKNLINTSSEDPVSVVCWGSNDSAGVYITRDSLSNGEIKYRKSDLNSDSSSWFNAINNW